MKVRIVIAIEIETWRRLTKSQNRNSARQRELCTERASGKSKSPTQLLGSSFTVSLVVSLSLSLFLALMKLGRDALSSHTHTPTHRLRTAAGNFQLVFKGCGGAGNAFATAATKATTAKTTTTTAAAGEHKKKIL